MKLVLCTVNRDDIDQEDSIYTIATKKCPNGWKVPFTEALPNIQILDELLKGKLFFPLKKHLFAAYDMCPLNNVRVVIVGQDPYHSTFRRIIDGKEVDAPQARGASFMTEKGCPIQPSLQNIYAELEREYEDFKAPSHGSLVSWARQGVLLLNTCLTVSPHKARSHGKLKIWEGFSKIMLEHMIKANDNLVFMVWGNDGIEFSESIWGNALILKATHPSPHSWKKSSKAAPAFWGCNHFKLANEYLVENGGQEIDWRIEE